MAPTPRPASGHPKERRERATLGRFAALAAVLLAAVLVGVVLLGGGGGTKYAILFQNAGQLVTGDEVQVAGTKVGSVEEITLTEGNEARIGVKIEGDLAPLHEGTRAIIRMTSLSGIANRYINLAPGPDSAPALREGAVIPAERTTAPVDLDQLFNTLDAPTRADLQKLVEGFATQLDGRGPQANDAARYASPATSAAARLVGQIDADQQSFTDFVVDSSRVMSALAERRGDLAGLVGNANATARAIGSENVALARALGLLPATLRQANTTFVNLRTTLDDLDGLVDASKPVARRLRPFLKELRPLLADARPTIRDLRRLVRTRGRDNDLTDLLVKTPALQRLARPVFQRQVATLQRSQPVLEFVRPYAPDLVGWIRDFGQGAANYDANGHYARIQPMFNAFQYTDNPAGGLLTPLDPALRNLGIDVGNLRRCPGGASQPRPDDSAPYRDDGDLDCDPSQSPGGF